MAGRHGAGADFTGRGVRPDRVRGEPNYDGAIIMIGDELEDIIPPDLWAGF